MAVATSSRATCSRRRVGAVLVRDRRLLGAGYNGSLPGAKHCIDVGCEENLEGRCIRAVHAEQNLLSYTERQPDCTVYATDRPCLDCMKALAVANIVETVWLRPHARDWDEFKVIADASKMVIRQYEPLRPHDIPTSAAALPLERTRWHVRPDPQRDF